MDSIVISFWKITIFYLRTTSSCGLFSERCSLNALRSICPKIQKYKALYAIRTLKLKYGKLHSLIHLTNNYYRVPTLYQGPGVTLATVEFKCFILFPLAKSQMVLPEQENTLSHLLPLKNI